MASDEAGLGVGGFGFRLWGVILRRVCLGALPQLLLKKGLSSVLFGIFWAGSYFVYEYGFP